MSAAERRRLFDKLAYTPDFLREIGYVVLLEEVDKFSGSPHEWWTLS